MHADSCLHCVAFPCHSFVTTPGYQVMPWVTINSLVNKGPHRTPYRTLAVRTFRRIGPAWADRAGLGSSMATALPHDDLSQACSGSDHAAAALLSVSRSDRIFIVAATKCLFLFLLDPAAALGRVPPGATWRHGARSCSDWLFSMRSCSVNPPEHALAKIRSCGFLTSRAGFQCSCDRCIPFYSAAARRNLVARSQIHSHAVPSRLPVTSR